MNSNQGRQAVRRLPIGAEIQPAGQVGFRVWAPAARRVDVVVEGGGGAGLAAEGGGYHSGRCAGGAGLRYGFRLDGAGPFPDPASRFQPEGPDGPSEVIDPAGFPWTDGGWGGPAPRGQVIYEMHVGTVTSAGRWDAALAPLERLAGLGITVVELMPVAEFPGRFGWGYDGVDLFAPTRLYGRPDDFRRFVDTCHRLGMAVILDVVYNHFGPDGNHLKRYSPDYFSRRYENEWGEALNFDGPACEPVREFFMTNARYWIEEFHLDGLRLDATQQMFDASPRHIIADLAATVRAAAAGRATLLVAENEPQHTRLARSPQAGGFGLDMLWNDDLHHSALVAATGRHEAYYSDHRGAPQEFVSAAKYGYLFQGQRYQWQGKRRGTPSFGLDPAAFVNYLQNHDQIANSGRGQRLHQIAAGGCWRALTALALLMPGTPMLFQGQEFAASAPFDYFADHKPDLARQVKAGRAEFLAQFPSLATPAMQACLADPADPATFERCRLDWSEWDRHGEALALHRDLLRLRRDDPVLVAPAAGSVDGAVLGAHAFLLRWFGPGGDDRLLLVNLGRDLQLAAAPEPLLAPPEGRAWAMAWASEDPAYAGCGAPAAESDTGWLLSGLAAVLLRAVADVEGACAS